MKTVVVQSYCDLDSEPGEVPATDEVTYEGRLLDVCAEHKQVVEDAIQAVADLFASGVPIGEAPKASRPRKGVGGRAPNPDMSTLFMRTCQDCGYAPPTRSALGQHVKQKHAKVLSNYDWST